MKRFRFSTLLQSLAALIALTFLTEVTLAQTGELSYRNSPRYKQELREFVDAGGRNIEHFDKYYLAYIEPFEQSRLDRFQNLANLPTDITEAFWATVKQNLNLNPNRPISEQLEIRSTNYVTLYVPVKGAEKLTPSRMDFYHRFLFTDRLRPIADGISPALERAQVALQQCDQSLLDQAQREIEFVVAEFERMWESAQEQKSLIAHQIRYYEQEVNWLDPEMAREDPRREWRNRLGINPGADKAPPNIAEYLGLPEGQDHYVSNSQARNEVVRTVNARIDVLNRWKSRIDEVTNYLDRNLPRLKDNQLRIRLAFRNSCSECR
ncbi:MAG: hypothetical protein KJZ92_16645 [Rhodocyclaceae bacterium]|jgi:hypothetical protein|nr:hypothetical protein [Rhodocyclaceae bacterium]MCL4682880.1 hypothetical protein [Rhodocyclaceae bacterium]